MYLASLRTHQFRNLTDAAHPFTLGVNVIVGKNGQGKTNLIEAINVLSISKSFRTSVGSDLVRWGCEEYSLFGTVRSGGKSGVQDEMENEIGVSVSGKQRSFYLNQHKLRSVTEFVGHLITVTFTPADLMLLQGAPSERRKFIDKHMVDLAPGLLTPLLHYQRALQNKNKLLKTADPTPRELAPWNEILAREGVAIRQARRSFVEALHRRAAALHAHYCPRDEPLTLIMKETTKGDVHEMYRELEVAFERERATRSSVVGPHRDDLTILLGPRAAQSFASQGQTRSIVLSLTLGVIELIEERRGEPPVVLLDDVNSELDSDRSGAFFALVKAPKRQIFITGTDASVGHLSATEGYSVKAMEGGILSDVTS